VDRDDLLLRGHLLLERVRVEPLEGRVHLGVVLPLADRAALGRREDALAERGEVSAAREDLDPELGIRPSSR